MRTQDVVVFRTHLDAIRCPREASDVLTAAAQSRDGIHRNASDSKAVTLGRGAARRDGGSGGALVHAQARHHAAQQDDEGSPREPAAKCRAPAHSSPVPDTMRAVVTAWPT